MFQLFVVFHKKIYDECYEAIPQDILDKYFTFVAVNPDIPKTYTKNKYKIINEWELPEYNSQFQEKGYNENSAIYHLKANGLHEQYKYVGFFQYDMKFTMNAIETIIEHMDEQPTCFYMEAYNFRFCCVETWNESHVMREFMRSYQSFFGKNMSMSDEAIYPLFNTYVIPVETYERVLSFAESLYWNIDRIVIQQHFGHLGGLYERVMALTIGEENLRMIKIDVHHDHYYKNNLSREEPQ